MQALLETTDVNIYNELIRGSEEDTFLKGYEKFVWVVMRQFITYMYSMSGLNIVI